MTMQPRTAHVRVDTHVGTHVLHNHGWEREALSRVSSAATHTTTGSEGLVSPNGLTSLPTLSSPHTHIHLDKQDTKATGKRLSGARQSFPGRACCVGGVGGVCLGCFFGLPGHQHGAMPPSPPSAAAGIDAVDDGSGLLELPTCSSLGGWSCVSSSLSYFRG
jgi:hypothetical protein